MARSRIGISSWLRFVILSASTFAVLLVAPAPLAAQSCGGGGPMCGTVITPPASALDRPDRLYVMPVFWFPSDGWMSNSDDLERAGGNFMVHLRMAQVKYRAMLRHPYTGADRGTFALATWDAQAGKARVFQESVNQLRPLVLHSTRSVASLSSDENHRDMAVLAEALNATNCKSASCPFLFVIVNGHETTGTSQSGLVMNYGLNGGLGFVRLPFSVVRDSDGHADWYGNSEKPGVLAAEESIFQSTLLHELGHAFGLWHTVTMYPNLTYDYPRADGSHPAGDAFAGDDAAAFHDLAPRGFCQSRANPDANCVPEYTTYCNGLSSAERRLAMYCSPSIMSYSIFNQVYGCPAKDVNGHCAMPGIAATIEQEAGALLPEDVQILSKNELAFPELAASFDVLSENPGGVPLKRQAGEDIPDRGSPYIIPGHEPFKVSSSSSAFDFHDPRGRPQPEPRMSVGHYGKTIQPRGAAWDHLAMWRSTDTFNHVWFPLDFHFPEAVQITRIRVFTGYENGKSVAARLAIDADDVSADNPVRCLQVATPGGTPPLPNGEVALANGEGEGTCPAAVGAHRRYRIHLLHSSTSSDPNVVVRGVRLYARREVSPGVFREVELQGPREPIAKTTDGATNEWAGSPQVIVGGNQSIEPLSAPFDPETMWHSKYVGPGNWASIDIRLPEVAAMRSIIAYTGHSGQYNTAAEVEWQSYSSGAYVWRMANNSAEPTSLLTVSPTLPMTHVRVRFRAGASGWITVRGIRFFTDLGELFVPQSVQEPSATVSYSPSIAFSNHAVGFTAHSGNSGMAFSWNFGDGGTANGSQVAHTYASPGPRTVTVTSQLYCDTGFAFLCHSTKQSFVVDVHADTVPPTIEDRTNVTYRLEGNELGGRRVNYPIPDAFDNADGAIEPVCVPAAGSLFLVGIKNVNCTATDLAGHSASTHFEVIIVDTTPPTIAAMADIDAAQNTANGAVVTYQPPATHDIVDGDGVATCSPASGSTFPFGQTTVTCTATDHANRVAVPVTFKVNVPLAPAILGTTGAASPLVFTKAHYQFSTQATTPGLVELVEWSCGSGVVSGGPSLAVDAPPRRDFAILCTFSQTGATAVTMKFRGGNGVTREASIPVTPSADTTRPELTVADVTVTGNDPAVAGAIATFSPVATDNIAVDRVECLPVSGSLFPFGPTQVTCTAFDTSNNPSETKTFTVRVLDGVAPNLQQPPDITVTGSNPAIGGATATFTLVATDNVAVDRIACSPASGSLFPFGSTSVSCTAFDTSNQPSTSKTFTVKVLDGVAPILEQPADITLTGSNPAIAGATATFTPVATDNVGVDRIDCLPVSGSLFPFGTTSVSCTAFDTSNTPSTAKTFTVKVLDGVAPSLEQPADITVTGSNPALAGAAATFSPVATDNVGVDRIECSPASGSLFPFGTTSVSCTAFDTSNQPSAAKTFTVKVLDGVAPNLQQPADITVTGNDPAIAGAMATFSPIATDNVGVDRVECSPASGSLFPFGSTPVSCKAFDAANNPSPSMTFTVKVRDGVLPVVTVPANITREATGANGVAVTFAASATDNVSGALAPACSPASGHTFAIGTTTVTCTATDAAQNHASASFTVTVTDRATPGEMRGDGFVRDDDARYAFQFLAREKASGAERAKLSIRIDENGKKKKGKKRDDRFESRSVDFIAFSDDPSIRPGRQRRTQVDTVLFSGVGVWNGVGGYRYEVFAQDEGEPGRHRESIRVKITTAGGALVASFEGELDGGNIQSMRIRH
jgi:hypothetical protein